MRLHFDRKPCWTSGGKTEGGREESRGGGREGKDNDTHIHILTFVFFSLPPSLPPSLSPLSATCFPEPVYDALRLRLAEIVKGEGEKEGG